MNAKLSLTALLASSLVLSCSTPRDTPPEAQPERPVTIDDPRPAEAARSYLPPGLTLPPLDSLELPATRSGFAGERPRFSPDGTTVVYHAGPEGARQLFLLSLGDTSHRPLAELPGDNRDPVFLPDGERVLYSSNREGSYDLFITTIDGGTTEKITDLAGDALEPAISPLSYDFFLVYDEGCGSGPSGQQTDAYKKIAFTLRGDDGDAVHFTSLRPRVAPMHPFLDRRIEVSEHGNHQGRLSPDGRSCRQPSYSLDGLHLTFTCDEEPVVIDATARYDQSFEAAVEALDDTAACGEAFDEEEREDLKECLASLPRRYTRYQGPNLVGTDNTGYERPSHSTNHIYGLADNAGSPGLWSRINESFQPLEMGLADVRNLVWSPRGDLLMFDTAVDDGPREIGWALTNFYLQDVRNLHVFPELSGPGRSDLLHEERFVARPSEEVEFYALYEKLRYQRRPQHITADAILQAFRDEFLRILQTAEEAAHQAIRELSNQLFDHFAEAHQSSGDAGDRYLAIYFGVSATILNAARGVIDSRPEPEPWADSGPPTPMLEDLPRAIRDAADELSTDLAPEIGALLERILAHQGIEYIPVPSYNQPFPADFSLFRVRGNYARNDLAGYFLAMTWFSLLPLPFDASLARVMDALGEEGVQKWSSVDASVGSFLGAPADATISHLLAARQASPELFSPFSTDDLRADLRERVGPVLIRDGASHFGEGADGASRAIKVVFFPHRVGLDTTFFRHLTHPDVQERPFPGSLDVFATLGVPRAHELALARESQERWGDAYRDALSALREDEDHRLASTDIYHSWLAVLLTLARSYELNEAPLHAFTDSPAWQDRLLLSSLAGYAQLKHSAVLYSAQDMGVECGGYDTYYAYIEQPRLPMPRGSLDPIPTFFGDLAELADRIYVDLHRNPEGPQIRWNWNESTLNVSILARDLERIAEAERTYGRLSDEDLRFIEFIGGRLEALTMGLQPDRWTQIAGGSRAEDGVLLAADIHTNAQRGEVLQVAVGGLLNLYVIVPEHAGASIAQGGIASFYEFLQPASARLTDDDWAALHRGDDAPKLPTWTGSFLEEAP